VSGREVQGRIGKRLAELRNNGDKGLIAYVTAGDPDLKTTVSLALRLAEAGADLIELGVPFSDPLADGPVIQEASRRALENGATVRGVLETAREIRRNSDIPLILMTYYNPVYQFSLEAFVQAAVSAGVDGLILPDLPLEESGPLLEAGDGAGLDLIPLVAPTTTDKRLRAIAASARGFIYCVSVTGVTGYREEIQTDIAKFTKRVRETTSLPLAVGFGISGPDGAAQMAAHCDAVVVGSAFVKIIAEKGAQAGDEVAALAREIRAALKGTK